MTAALTTYLLILLATTRITRLITIDKITDPLRRYITNRNGPTGWWTYLIHCPWCIGIWTAAPATLTTWYGTTLPYHLHAAPWIALPALWLTTAYLTGWIITQGEHH